MCDILNDLQSLWRIALYTINFTLLIFYSFIYLFFDYFYSRSITLDNIFAHSYTKKSGLSPDQLELCIKNIVVVVFFKQNLGIFNNFIKNVQIFPRLRMHNDKPVAVDFLYLLATLELKIN